MHRCPLRAHHSFVDTVTATINGQGLAAGCGGDEAADLVSEVVRAGEDTEMAAGVNVELGPGTEPVHDLGVERGEEWCRLDGAE